MIDDCFNCYRDILLNKREAIFLFKIHEEILGYYADKLNSLSYKTQKSYSRIISKFITFSPSLDPADLNYFIKAKLNFLT